MGGFSLTPLAINDLEDIWAYTFEAWGVRQADCDFEDIMVAIAQLANGERKGRPVTIRKGYLRFQSGKHFIFFRFNENEMLVVRILHQSMDYERHL